MERSSAESQYFIIIVKFRARAIVTVSYRLTIVVGNSNSSRAEYEAVYMI